MLRLASNPAVLRYLAEQRTDNADKAARFGVTVKEPYVEPHAVGASRHSRGEREAFDKLMRDLEARRFGADVLIMWEGSRGSRKVSEWAALLERCEEQGIKILVSAGGGKLYDPADARDRRSLLEDAVDSEWEAAKTSERTRRAAKANAAAGRPHGPAPYGYVAVHHPRTGHLITWEPDPEKAPVIRELFERVHKGHSFKGGVARDIRGAWRGEQARWPVQPAASSGPGQSARGGEGGATHRETRSGVCSSQA